MKQQDGVATLLAILVLAILTIIGIGAMTSSTQDIKVTQNRQIYRQNFAQAEAAVREAAEYLEELSINFVIDGSGNPMGAEGSLKGWDTEDADATTETPGTTDGDWLHWGDAPDNNNLPNPNNIADPANWADGISATSTTLGNNVRYLVVGEGQSGSISMTGGGSAMTYKYSIYGRADAGPTDENRGEVIIRVGYKRRWS